MPRLLEGVASRTPQHREMLLRLAAAGLQAYADLPPASQLGSEADFAARLGGLVSDNPVARRMPA